MEFDAEDGTYLRITAVETQGTLPAKNDLCLAPGQTAVVGRTTARCQLAVADRWLTRAHFEIQAGAHEHVIRDLSGDADKHAACGQRCFLAELRNKPCPEAFCAAANSGSTGLRLNGKSVREAALRDRDLLGAGTTSFRIQISPEPFPDSAASSAGKPRALSKAQQTTLLEHLSQGPVYAVLDAARGPGARSLRLQHEDLSYSLYDGPAGDQLAEVAPYLIALESESQLLLRWLNDHWGEAYGYFLASDAPFKALRRHLRKFLKVEDARGRRMHFRFYDPRVLRTFLPTCTPQEVAEFFGPISHIIAESHEPPIALSFRAESAGLRGELLRLDDTGGRP